MPGTEREPPVVLGERYRVDGRLGAGGSSSVWRGRDLLLGRTVTVKRIPSRGDAAEAAGVRLAGLREAQLLAAIDDPRIVRVLDVVDEPAGLALILEYVDGRSLAEQVVAEGPLTLAAAVRIGQDIAAALDTLHRADLAHGDVKPANVLVEHHTGRVVLTDLGVAAAGGRPSRTLVSSDTDADSAGSPTVGSVAYIAPERLYGDPPTPPADLWSLGATLWAIVEGSPPYGIKDLHRVARNILAGRRPPFRRAGVLAPVLDRLLARDPARRGSAADARDYLGNVMAHGDEPTSPDAVAPCADG